MSCDECKYYNWYYDYCRKWDCKIDGKAVHNCYEKMDTPIADAIKEVTHLKEAKEKQMKCKDCYWYSDVTVKCCERDGSEPCNPHQPICSEYEPRE